MLALLAQVAQDPAGTILSFVDTIFTNVMNSNYWMAAAGLVSLLTFLVHWKGAKLWAPLATIPGGIISSFVLATLLGLINGIAAQGFDAISWAMILTALKVGGAAVGGWGALLLLGKHFLPGVFGEPATEDTETTP